MHCPHNKASRSSGPVAGTEAGWLAGEVGEVASSIDAPGNRRSPTIRPVTKCTTKSPADAWLLMQEPESQNIEVEISKLVQNSSADAATVGCNDASTSTARCCRDSGDKINDKRGRRQKRKQDMIIRRLRACHVEPKPLPLLITVIAGT